MKRGPREATRGGAGGGQGIQSENSDREGEEVKEEGCIVRARS